MGGNVEYPLTGSEQRVAHIVVRRDTQVPEQLRRPVTECRGDLDSAYGRARVRGGDEHVQLVEPWGRGIEVNPRTPAQGQPGRRDGWERREQRLAPGGRDGLAGDRECGE